MSPSFESPRLRRLRSDHKAMTELASVSTVFSFRTSGDPPDHYTLSFAGPGTYLDASESRIHLAHRRLRYAAGNFYVNDKPTGAVVGMQPFGGSRASGTNDKSGSMLNLCRWATPRTVKETFVPPTDFRYPFMDEE